MVVYWSQWSGLTICFKINIARAHAYTNWNLLFVVAIKTITVAIKNGFV